MSLAVGVVGSGVATWLYGFGAAVALGTVPAHLLAVVAMARMQPAAIWRMRPGGQRLSSLLIFVLSFFVILHVGYGLLALRPGHVAVLSVIQLDVLAGALALASGAALAVLAHAPTGRRRSAVLLLVTQSCGVVASSLAAQASGSVTAGMACAVSIVGIGVLILACLGDHELDTGVGPLVAEAPVGPALLPHVTALVAGALLLGSAPLRGFDICAAGVGLLGFGAIVVHQVAVLRDQRRLTGQLRSSEAHFRSLARSSVDPLIILDDDLCVRWASDAVADMLGPDPRCLVGRSITTAVHPDDLPAIQTALQAPTAASSDSLTVTGRLQRPDGAWRLIQARVRDLRQDPDVSALVLYCREITTSSRAADPAAGPAAARGAAAGLGSRSALAQQIGNRLAAGTRPLALALLQSDGGLSDGLWGRLSQTLRRQDWLVCCGNSEFAVVVEGTETDAEAAADRLLTCLSRTAGQGDRVPPAAGVTDLDTVTEAGEALRRAELALTTARSTGGGKVWRYSEAVRIARLREEELRADLGRALTRRELRVVFQPIVDLALHRVDKVEALLRWRHPFHGEVSPAEFIPLAEHSGLVADLGRWVLEQATAAVAAVPGIGVAVNVSAGQIGSGRLEADVRAALAASGLSASRLTLEVTESLPLEDADVAGELQALRQLGVGIGLDDFGTGWSSLASLASLPVDVLKMDRRFLVNLATDLQRRKLCRMVLALGEALDLDIIVEGVETTADLELLRNMGHRYIQGFVFARPIESERLIEELRTLHHSRPGMGAGPAPAAAVVLDMAST